MAAAPPDPYRGLSGIERAWEDVKAWLMVTLPRQWNDLAGLLALLGAGSGGAGGGAGGGGTVPPDQVRNYPIPAGYRLSDLSLAGQDEALRYVATWPDAYSRGVWIDFTPDHFRYTPDPVTVAIALLGWTANPRVGHTYITPWNAPDNPINGDRFWYPGLQFRW